MPCVAGTPLDDNVSGGEMHLSFIEFEVELAREHNAVVDRARRVHLGILLFHCIPGVKSREIPFRPGAGGQKGEHTHDRPTDGWRKVKLLDVHGIDSRPRIWVGGIVDPDFFIDGHTKIKMARSGSIMDEVGPARYFYRLRRAVLARATSLQIAA